MKEAKIEKPKTYDADPKKANMAFVFPAKIENSRNTPVVTDPSVVKIVNK